MNTAEIKSAFLKLSQSDVVKSAINAGLGAISGAAYQAYQAGTLFDLVVLKGLATGFVLAGATDVFRRLFTNSRDQFAKVEPPVQQNLPGVK